jgi:hypothetical protein
LTATPDNERQREDDDDTPTPVATSAQPSPTLVNTVLPAVVQRPPDNVVLPQTGAGEGVDGGWPVRLVGLIAVNAAIAAAAAWQLAKGRK